MFGLGGWVRSKYGLIVAVSGAFTCSNLTPQKNCKPPLDYVICAVYNTLLLQLWYNLSHSCQRNYLALFFYLHSSVINEIKLPTGNSIYDSDELSDAFNDHFYSMGTRLANDIQVNVDSISIKNNTSISKVTSLLSKLCKSKSTGLDTTSAPLLRECAVLK